MQCSASTRPRGYRVCLDAYLTAPHPTCAQGCPMEVWLHATLSLGVGPYGKKPSFIRVGGGWRVGVGSSEAVRVALYAEWVLLRTSPGWVAHAPKVVQHPPNNTHSPRHHTQSSSSTLLWCTLDTFTSDSKVNCCAMQCSAEQCRA